MKHIKMMLYGEPGVGKSVFASKAPNPFFITTDGNYEWLEDFGAKPEAHKQVYSWDEAKKVFESDFDGYDTIVVDLVEDLFKWCEQEYCTRAKLEHISDVGYGKGYDITRNEFFLEISKLLGKPKNVILISHGITFSTKDRRGVEHYKHAPSSRIPDKVLDMIEGRLRYCLRCYLKAEEQPDKTLAKKRYLSLIPKENEFGICRGVDEATTPHDIVLDWNEFAKAIKLDSDTMTTSIDTGYIPNVEPVSQITTEPAKVEVVEASIQNPKLTPVEPKPEVKVEPQPQPQPEPVQTVQPEPIQAAPQPIETPVAKSTEPIRQLTNEEKIAAIKAKLAAMKGNN